jgi:hypothetical protein
MGVQGGGTGIRAMVGPLSSRGSEAEHPLERSDPIPRKTPSISSLDPPAVFFVLYYIE